MTHMIPLADRVLLQVSWTDCTNVAGSWHDEDDLAGFATNGAWECTNTGWLVWEDDRCLVLAGRMTDDGKNVGLVERIPKSAITARKEIAPVHVHNQWLCPAHAGGCDCRDPDSSLCNPYRMAGFCPDDLTVMPGDAAVDRQSA